MGKNQSYIVMTVLHSTRWKGHHCLHTIRLHRLERLRLMSTGQSCQKCNVHASASNSIRHNVSSIHCKILFINITASASPIRVKNARCQQWYRVYTLCRRCFRQSLSFNPHITYYVGAADKRCAGRMQHQRTRSIKATQSAFRVIHPSFPSPDSISHTLGPTKNTLHAELDQWNVRTKRLTIIIDNMLSVILRWHRTGLIDALSYTYIYIYIYIYIALWVTVRALYPGIYHKTRHVCIAGVTSGFADSWYAVVGSSTSFVLRRTAETGNQFASSMSRMMCAWCSFRRWSSSLTAFFRRRVERNESLGHDETMLFNHAHANTGTDWWQ